MKLFAFGIREEKSWEIQDIQMERENKRLNISNAAPIDGWGQPMLLYLYHLVCWTSMILELSVDFGSKSPTWWVWEHNRVICKDPQRKRDKNREFDPSMKSLLAYRVWSLFWKLGENFGSSSAHLSNFERILGYGTCCPKSKINLCKASLAHPSY
jgi:hypothetical protein